MSKIELVHILCEAEGRVTTEMLLKWALDPLYSRAKSCPTSKRAAVRSFDHSQPVGDQKEWHLSVSVFSSW